RPVLGGGRHLDLVPGRRVLHGVVDQVDEHLTEPFAVAAHVRERSRDGRSDPHLVLREASRRDRLVDELLHVDVVEREAERAGVDARGVEDVADQRGEARRLAGDQGEERRALVGRELAPALLERLGRPDDRSHRAPQLVGDERDEVGAEAREAAQLVGGRALGLVGADVLHRCRDEPAEQRRQLDLLGREGGALPANDREHADGPGAEQERRAEPRARAQRLAASSRSTRRASSSRSRSASTARFWATSVCSSSRFVSMPTIAPTTSWRPTANVTWSVLKAKPKREWRNASEPTRNGAMTSGMTRPPRRPNMKAASITGRNRSAFTWASAS